MADIIRSCSTQKKELILTYQVVVLKVRLFCLLCLFCDDSGDRTVVCTEDRWGYDNTICVSSCLVTIATITAGFIISIKLCHFSKRGLVY